MYVYILIKNTSPPEVFELSFALIEHVELLIDIIKFPISKIHSYTLTEVFVMLFH